MADSRMLPKELLVYARKLQGEEVLKAVAGEVAKARESNREPSARGGTRIFRRDERGVPNGAVFIDGTVQSDLIPFGAGIVTMNGRDYIADDVEISTHTNGIRTTTVRLRDAVPI